MGGETHKAPRSLAELIHDRTCYIMVKTGFPKDFSDPVLLQLLVQGFAFPLVIYEQVKVKSVSCSGVSNSL